MKLELKYRAVQQPRQSSKVKSWIFLAGRKLPKSRTDGKSGEKGGVFTRPIKVKSHLVAAVLRREKSGKVERELPWFGIGTTTTYIVRSTGYI